MEFLNGIQVGNYYEIAPRDGFGEALLELGEKNKRVVALTADLAESTRVHRFAEQYPDRFFEVGVAEQNMIGIAAGLALSGYIPFASSYGVFSPGRNWDQIRVSICYSQANVKVVGAHAGLSVGADGATHQALEDIAITRVLPNMVVVVPADSVEARKATLALSKYVGPAYLRFGREKAPVITTKETPFELGRAITVKNGSDVTVIANGPMVFMAMKAANHLKGKVDVRILNMHTVKPLDERAVLSAAKETGAIVTAEDHQITGGLGGAVAEVVSESCPVPVVRVGMKDCFGESGKPEELMSRFGLSAPGIVEAINLAMEKKHAR